MANPMFSFEQTNWCSVEDYSSSTKMSSEFEEGGKTRTECSFSWSKETVASGGVYSLCSDNRTCQDESWSQELLFSKHGQQEKLQQSFFDEEVKSKLEKHDGNGRKRLRGETIIESSHDKSCKRKLSTEQSLPIICTDSFSQEIDIAPMLNKFFHLFLCLKDEDTKNVELAKLLLACAEEVGNQQFDCAVRLLKHIDSFSSDNGNPVQRLVYYFSKALRERIDIQSRRIPSKGLEKEEPFDMDFVMRSLTQNSLPYHVAIPFCQIAHFAGIQIILNNIAVPKRIHVIDLEIRIGILQWIFLMQALAHRYGSTIELLKITVIGTMSKQLIIENTGENLMTLAHSLNLPFSFKMVAVSDFLDLSEDLIELDGEETVAVFSDYLPRSFIALPKRLNSILKIIKNINPCVIVVVEAEANPNSPAFVNRFMEALFFYGTYFVFHDAYMERDDENRMVRESFDYGKGIRNTIVNEGEERKLRNVQLDGWRTFFTDFGMEEIDLSSSALVQENLVVKKFACGNCFTFDRNGKSLIIGWKGVPLHSLSAWKFTH